MTTWKVVRKETLMSLPKVMDKIRFMITAMPQKVMILFALLMLLQLK